MLGFPYTNVAEPCTLGLPKKISLANNPPHHDGALHVLSSAVQDPANDSGDLDTTAAAADEKLLQPCMGCSEAIAASCRLDF